MSIVVLLITIWDYSYNFTTDFTYNNNIFSYSSEYIDDFMNQIHSYRFPFETYDDLINSTNLKLYLRNRFFSAKTTTFNVDIKINNYLINKQKDYLRINTGLRQSFGKYALKVAYNIIPYYLIRYYRNPEEDSSDYMGCEVKYQTLSGKVSFKLKPSIFYDIQYKRRWENYIPEFNVYDARAHIVQFDTKIDLQKNTQLSIGYEFRTTKSDSATELQTGSEPVPDGAYDMHVVKGGFLLRFKTICPTTLKTNYTYQFRNFTAISHIDSMHFGRQDHIQKIEVSTGLRIFTGMNLEISYLRQWRNATSEIFIDIDGIKDYSKFQISSGISFYY